MSQRGSQGGPGREKEGGREKREREGKHPEKERGKALG